MPIWSTLSTTVNLDEDALQIRAITCSLSLKSCKF